MRREKCQVQNRYLTLWWHFSDSKKIYDYLHSIFRIFFAICHDVMNNTKKRKKKSVRFQTIFRPKTVEKYRKQSKNSQFCPKIADCLDSQNFSTKEDFWIRNKICS